MILIRILNNINTLLGEIICHVYFNYLQQMKIINFVENNQFYTP